MTKPRNPVQGEGDYQSAARYNEKQRDFVERSDVEQLARDAAPKGAAESAELEKAEAAGRERAVADDTRTDERPGPQARDDQAPRRRGRFLRRRR